MVLVSHTAPESRKQEEELTVAQPDYQVQFSLDIDDSEVDLFYPNLHARVDLHQRRNFSGEVDLRREIVYI